jgi:tRNA-dihydrouridine synthase B
LLRIGPYCIDTRVVLAPMAGVTDQPYRALCARMGTRLAIAEMISADTRLWQSRKSQLRLTSTNDAGIRWVQIVGNDPEQMADAARAQADLGAQIVDINMGCPAKTVCRKAAGSALLRDEALVARILRAVVSAVPQLPVTLKIRTGWSPEQRNGVSVARIAEDSGIRALSVHGRTRACRFGGEAEYDTIRDIVAAVSIPVIANGDIDSPQRAQDVLRHTGAQAVMIGRAAQGRPWLCAQVDAWLRNGEQLQVPPRAAVGAMLLEHVAALHGFHGSEQGPRVARKHVGWYLAGEPRARDFLQDFHRIGDASQQLATLAGYFQTKTEYEGMAA